MESKKKNYKNLNDGDRSTYYTLSYGNKIGVFIQSRYSNAIQSRYQKFLFKAVI